MVLEDLRRCLFAGADAVIEREQELSELDSVVGDGDHGITVRKGYQKAKAAVEAGNPQTLSDLMMSAGMGLAETSGGAIGPILANLFIGMSGALMGKDELNTPDLAAMFASGLAAVQDMGGAQPGDCTMVDTLYPFVQSLNAAGDVDMKEALTEACKKAWEGSEATRDMIPRLGRAHNLGERAIGYIDAGSRSMYYFLNGFSEAL